MLAREQERGPLASEIGLQRRAVAVDLGLERRVVGVGEQLDGSLEVGGSGQQVTPRVDLRA